MQIFLDSADIQEIHEIWQYGFIDGITTNPSLIAKTTGNFKESITKICKIALGGVSVEVSANDYAGMLEQGKKILKIADNIILKLPITLDGIRACKYFSSNGVKVNMTLCFSANQALIASKVGASYVSPFIGRLDDIGWDGMQLIQDIKRAYNNYSDLSTKILAASIRSTEHVHRCALFGADVATIPGKIIKQLLHHPLTDKGLEIFNKDWHKSGLSI